MIEIPPLFAGDRIHYQMIHTISYTLSLHDAISLLRVNRYYHSLRNDIEIQKVLIELAKVYLKDVGKRESKQGSNTEEFIWEAT